MSTCVSPFRRSQRITVRRGIHVGPHVDRKPGPIGPETFGRSYGLAAFRGQSFKGRACRLVTIWPDIFLAEIEHVHHVHGPGPHTPQAGQPFLAPFRRHRGQFIRVETDSPVGVSDADDRFRFGTRQAAPTQRIEFALGEMLQQGRSPALSTTRCQIACAALTEICWPEIARHRYSGKGRSLRRGNSSGPKREIARWRSGANSSAVSRRWEWTARWGIRRA